MDYTIVVNASASEPAPLLFLAPYAGVAMGEEFMYNGKDVLIIYDDLSKHAVAYRECHCYFVVHQDVKHIQVMYFYLHSRLLERAAKLNDELGGGSITALPIIETQAGDVSAYIPTNVISITDGQIYLEAELFNSGQRPAVNSGISVSRVGGDAQIKGMKKVAGKIRLELAQYRELAAFAQFGSDLDKATQETLSHGARLMEVLKQKQYQPMNVADQVMMIYAVTNKYLADVPVHAIARFEEEFLTYMADNCPDVGASIKASGVISDEMDGKLVEAIGKFKEGFAVREEQRQQIG